MGADQTTRHYSVWAPGKLYWRVCAGAAAGDPITVPGLRTHRTGQSGTGFAGNPRPDLLVGVLRQQYGTAPAFHAEAVDGANTNTNIAVADITTADRVLTVLELGANDLQTAVVTGGAAAAQLACAGILTTDTLVAAVLFDGGVPSSVLSEASIPAAGKVALSTTNSTGKTILVIWRSGLLVTATARAATVHSAGNIRIAADTRGKRLLVLWAEGSGSTGITADLIHEASITADGEVTLSDTDTTGDTLLVLFVSEDGEGGPLT